MILTAPQRRYLGEIRAAGRAGKTYNGRARRVLDALVAHGLISYTYSMSPRATAAGTAGIPAAKLHATANEVKS
jgi:hypothetical protein